MQNLSVDYTPTIPPDVWLNILNRFSPSELAVVSLVSPFFHALFNDRLLWEKQTRRNYPDTYHAKLSESYTSRDRVDWKQLFIERVGLFSATKKDQLKRTTLLTNVTYFDILDGKIYAFVFENLNFLRRSLISSIVNEKLICIKIDYPATCFKVEKRSDGKVYVYTNARAKRYDNEVIGWEFCETHFEQKLKLEEPRHTNATFAFNIPPDQDSVISADSYEICIWDKNTGKSLKRLPCDKENGEYSSLAITKNRILAGTNSGTIKIWDASTYKLLATSTPGHPPCPITNIQVCNEKIFYSTIHGIHLANLKTEFSQTILVSRICGLVDVWDNRIFFVKGLTAYTQEIRAMNAETLALEPAVFSTDNSILKTMRVGLYGILQTVSGTSIELRLLEPDTTTELQITQKNFNTK